MTKGEVPKVSKKTIILCLCLSVILLQGCTKTYLNIEEEVGDVYIKTNEQDDKTIEEDPEESKVIIDTKNNKKETYNTFFSLQAEYMYDVVVFLDETISEVPIKVTDVASYENGNVYSLNINYNDCPGRYFWGESDRFNLGMYYVTENNIYLISDVDEIPQETDFTSNGIEIFSSEDSEINIDGLRITIENTEDMCTCTMTNTLTESGYYSIYKWNKAKELKYYCSGYGAGGDPIELRLIEPEE